MAIYELFSIICRRLNGATDYSGTKCDFDAVEEQLGLELPYSFKWFWGQSVVCAPPGCDLYRPAITPGELADVNRGLRDQDGMPVQLLVFGRTGDEDWLILDLRNPPDAPMIWCDAEQPLDSLDLEPFAGSFEHFLLEYCADLVATEVEILNRLGSELDSKRASGGSSPRNA